MPVQRHPKGSSEAKGGQFAAGGRAADAHARHLLLEKETYKKLREREDMLIQTATDKADKYYSDLAAKYEEPIDTDPARYERLTYILAATK